MVPLLLKQHLSDRYQNTALMLSFHGMSGVGKIMLSRLIAEHLYKRGTKSKFVKTFTFQFVENPDFYKVIRQFDTNNFSSTIKAYIY